MNFAATFTTPSSSWNGNVSFYFVVCSYLSVQAAESGRFALAHYFNVIFLILLLFSRCLRISYYFHIILRSCRIICTTFPFPLIFHVVLYPSLSFPSPSRPLLSLSLSFYLLLHLPFLSPVLFSVPPSHFLTVPLLRLPILWAVVPPCSSPPSLTP